MTWGPGPPETSTDFDQVELAVAGATAVTSVGGAASPSAAGSPPAAGAAIAGLGAAGAHGSSGTTAHMTKYTSRNAPPVKMASNSHSTREMDGSMSK
jgi:hypothetical protein